MNNLQQIVIPKLEDDGSFDPPVEGACPTRCPLFSATDKKGVACPFAVMTEHRDQKPGEGCPGPGVHVLAEKGWLQEQQAELARVQALNSSAVSSREDAHRQTRRYKQWSADDSKKRVEAEEKLAILTLAYVATCCRLDSLGEVNGLLVPEVDPEVRGEGSGHICRHPGVEVKLNGRSYRIPAIGSIEELLAQDEAEDQTPPAPPETV